MHDIALSGKEVIDMDNFSPDENALDVRVHHTGRVPGLQTRQLAGAADHTTQSRYFELMVFEELRAIIEG